MATKPSVPWADEPFSLIPTPSKRPELAQETHASVHLASEMSHAHNTLIRGLNSIYQQAPYVPSSSNAAYQYQDVKDLMLYTANWAKTVGHHHDIEEAYIFPAYEALSGKPGSMDDPRHQHELIHAGLDRLLGYAQSTPPADYRWEGPGGMKEIVDSFTGPLTHHLTDEIDLLLGLRDLNHDAIQSIWKKAEAMATKQASLGLMRHSFPLVLGNADKTFEGGCEFPPLPWVLPYLVKYGFAVGNGAWRFNPCDFWGQPRPLAFGPGRNT